MFRALLGFLLLFGTQILDAEPRSSDSQELFLSLRFSNSEGYKFETAVFKDGYFEHRLSRGRTGKASEAEMKTCGHLVPVEMDQLKPFQKEPEKAAILLDTLTHEDTYPAFSAQVDEWGLDTVKKMSITNEGSFSVLEGETGKGAKRTGHLCREEFREFRIWALARAFRLLESPCPRSHTARPYFEYAFKSGTQKISATCHRGFDKLPSGWKQIWTKFLEVTANH